MTAKELLCRLLGHLPVFDRTEWYCDRCKDVLPEGNVARQP